MELVSLLHVAAALAMVGFWYAYALVLPFRRLPEGIHHLAVHPGWTPISLMGGGGCTLAVLALAATWRVHADALDGAGEVGILLAITGLVMLAGNLFWEAILWPVLSRETPEVLRFDGPVYGSRSLLGFFGTAGLIFSAGYVTLAWALPPAFPVGAAWCLGAGAPLFALGPLFGGLQVWVRSVGITALSVGHLWLGLVA